ncbi:MAG: carboxypeptidase regulatory-like domain-containing protein [Acidimicrobiales bacterium]
MLVAGSTLLAAIVLAVGGSAVGAEARQPEPDTAVGGQLVDDDDKPIAGVEISVEQGGEEIGTAETDDDGRWRIEVPGAGTYAVTLDTDSLPEGVGLRDPERSTLDGIRVREGQTRPVLFQLGEARSTGVSRIDRLFSLAVDGIRLGLILALCAVGLSLIFGVTGLTNFAHGELVTFGALVTFWLSASAGGPDLPFVAAAVLAVGAGAGAGFLLERGLFGPLRRRRTGNVSLIVFTIGLSLVLRHLYLILFGGRPRPFDAYTIQAKFDVGPISLRPKDYAVIAIAAVVLVLVGVMLDRTRLGTAMRAVSDSRDLAEASGIDVRRVVLATWMLGAGLAGLGGVLQGLSETVVWDMGFTLLLLIFAAVILGGIGTGYGAMVGALVLGLASQLSTYWIEPKFRTGVGLAILIVVVLFRPQGILGRAERVG